MAAIATSVIYRDDNLARLAALPADSVDLVYLDPPFFSNRQYEVVWGEENEMRSFRDRWKGGVPTYIDWMRGRAAQLHRVLKPNGSLYLHCDSAASHHLKVMMDGFFGPERFRNEITWQRTGAHSDAKRWSPVSDKILYYAKGDRPTWNAPRTPYSVEYVNARYRESDPNGRRYMLDNMTSPSPRPNMVYEWKGHASPRNGWRFSKETMERLDAERRIWYPNSRQKRPRLKRYLDEMPGMIVPDVWTDIPPVNARAREREGYPTQKPEALLERIILASSNPGDVVLDPFCGCGTTIAVAHKLNRHWIGIDISLTAARVMKQRLERLGARVTVIGVPDTKEDLQLLDPHEFQNWAIDAVVGEHAPRYRGDMGIDGYSFLERHPIQVKQTHVGREIVDQFETAVRRHGTMKGYIIALSFGKGAHKEAARAKDDGLEICLIPVSTLLDNPLDLAPEPGLDQMTTLLLTRAREAVAQRALRQPPRVAAQDLAESIAAQ